MSGTATTTENNRPLHLAKTKAVFGRLVAPATAVLLFFLGSTTGQSAQPFTLPGGQDDQALLATLTQAYTGEFASRTRYRHEDGQPIYINRMILEPSPYLRQHAHTPVDWHSWSAETLAMAQAQGRPIFLSIGYATCHWCHVMEEESFDNEAIAALINQGFIAVKVDREQHPEVDLLYMTALQITSESAGWPLTAVLLPSGEPFFISSYLPPDVLTTVLSESDRLWSEEPAELANFATSLSQAVQRFMALEGQARQLTVNDSLNAASSRLLDLDLEHGGLARAPKFPNETTLAWLMDLLELEASHPSLAEGLRLTLDGMQAGGIHDQVGGGFHRYAVDRAWRVPHFEKMLYNQAQLLALYARAAALFGDPSYQRTAERLIAFVLRDMTADDGLFYAGFDADSPEGFEDDAKNQEGLFYLWRAQEIEALLGEEGLLLAERLDIDDDFPVLGQASTAALAGASSPELDQMLERLRQARDQRPAPFLDKKRITAWNAQMIAGLALAARLLETDQVPGQRPRQEPSQQPGPWQQVAVRAGDQLWSLHWNQAGGELARFSLDGSPKGAPAHTQGGLQDYAFGILAYLSLHDLTGAPRFLNRAQQLAEAMTQLFWRPERGLFIGQSDDQSALFTAPIDTMDSSQPSDSSAAVLAIAKLARRDGNRQTLALANQALAGLSGRMGENPEAHATAWRAALRLWHPTAGFAGMGVAEGGIVRARLISGANQDAPSETKPSETKPSQDKSSQDKPSLTLAVDLADGWHINALEPLQSELIPTQLSWRASDPSGGSKTGQAVAVVEQPRATLRDVAYFDDPVAEYHGSLRFGFARPQGSASLVFAFQACNEQICLAPQSLTIAASIQP